MASQSEDAETKETEAMASFKAIDLKHSVIERISSRKDRSLGFSVSTPELTSEQAAAFLALHGANCRMMIQPLDNEADALIEIDAEPETKSPAQRLRAVIFLYFKSMQEARKIEADAAFSVFYSSKMEKLIEQIKRSVDTMK
jgi:hypothetical protein